MNLKMNEPNENPPRRYKWPWFVLAAFVLFVLLAIVWMSFAVRMVEQKRNRPAPPPTNSEQWPL
jgi:hypothetical protein